jgi:tRNA(adenine34) deaminase
MSEHDPNLFSPMSRAIELAREAYARGEVPVGCVIVDGESGEMIAEASNRCEERGNPTAHAELLAITAAAEKAGQKSGGRLAGADLYVTLEPCAMCAAAISFARLRRVYFGAYDPKMGGVEHGPKFFTQPTCHHGPEVVGGLDETICRQLMQDFFKEKR